MDRSRVLICGIGGSGHYLVWRIVHALQSANGVYRSFRDEVGLSHVIGHYRPRAERKFPEEPGVDAVIGGQMELHIPGCRLVGTNPALVNGVSSLLWTNDRPREARETWPDRKRIYLIRNGLDVVTSILHKVVKPDMRAVHGGECETVEELLDLEVDGEGYVERIAKRWADHVRNYLSEMPEDWIPVRYEPLSGGQKHLVVKGLAKSLGFNPSKELIDLILLETSVEKMREHAPNHVRRASPGGHRELPIRERVMKVAGDIMQWTGYV